MATFNILVNSGSVTKAGQRLDKLGTSSARAATLSKQVTSQFGKNESIVGSMKRTYSGLVIEIQSVIRGFQLLASAMAKPILVAAEFEQIEIGFQTLIGEGKLAKEILMEIEEFSKRTPFQFKPLAQAARLLKALGVEAKEIPETLFTIADATAAQGRGNEVLMRLALALGQVKTKGFAAGQEFRQFGEQGVAAWQFLANALGRDVAEVQKLAEQKKIKFEVIWAALLEGMQSRFSGAVENLALTTAGLLSTLKDNLIFAMRDVGNTLIDTLDIRGRMTQLIKDTNQLKDVASAAITTLLGFERPEVHLEDLEIRAKILGTTVDELREKLDTAWQSGVELAEKFVFIGRVLQSVFGVWVLIKFAKTLQWLKGIVTGFFALLSAHPFVLIAWGIAAVVGALWGFRNQLIELSGTQARVGDFIAAAWDNIVERFSVASQFIERAWQKHPIIVRNALRLALGDFGDFIFEMMDLMVKLSNFTKKDWVTMVNVMMAAWDTLVQFVSRKLKQMVLAYGHMGGMIFDPSNFMTHFELANKFSEEFFDSEGDKIWAAQKFGENLINGVLEGVENSAAAGRDEWLEVLRGMFVGDPVMQDLLDQWEKLGGFQLGATWDAIMSAARTRYLANPDTPQLFPAGLNLPDVGGRDKQPRHDDAILGGGAADKKALRDRLRWLKAELKRIRGEFSYRFAEEIGTEIRDGVRDGLWAAIMQDDWKDALRQAFMSIAQSSFNMAFNQAVSTRDGASNIFMDILGRIVGANLTGAENAQTEINDINTQLNAGGAGTGSPRTPGNNFGSFNDYGTRSQQVKSASFNGDFVAMLVANESQANALGSKMSSKVAASVVAKGSGQPGIVAGKIRPGKGR